MKKLKVELEHCYGITKLNAEFDFEANGDVFAVYAPNGVMKTSFANTFRDFSQGIPSSDRIWESKTTKRMIVDEFGNELAKETVFVIEPYNQTYRSERISTLLVNEGLRKRYDVIHKEIDEKAAVLISELKPRAGFKEGIKEELSKAITHDPNDFYRALVRIKEEVKEEDDTPLGDIVYNDIFNAKVADLLADTVFREKIRIYIEKYDELVSKSTFFKKGVFTHNNAAEIAKNLNANGFFKAEHSVYLRINGEKKEISSIKELERAIQSEKNRILTDDQLRTAFEAMDKQLTKNAELKKFRTCLEQNPVVLPELANPEKLKQKLWVAYLIRARNHFIELLDAFNAGKIKIAEIIEEAKNEHTKWAEVISIFNERFSVPFVVQMDNQVDVILKSVAPSIRFDFLEDANDKNSLAAAVEEGALIQVLSSGEKRALYILNIIFEVEGRKAARQKTLFVIDDIADSFDYKNKYAIIEYLKGISGEQGFQQIILSHNFDFYRTVSSRLQLKRECRMLADKTSEEVFLQQEVYQKSAPFSHWRKHLSNRTMLIASIPFLRNLAEFSGDDLSYGKLTSLLHMRPDTDQITVADLEGLIKGILHDQTRLSLDGSGSTVKDIIHQVSAEIAKDTSENYALEGKVVLSIAIRLKAEDIMIRKINDRAFWEGITSNQTIALIKRFKSDFAAEEDCIQIFEQVNLMTPENIHLNSFMYEPILDLSAQHLKKLYGKLCSMELSS
jgi:hypothetical protein